MINLTKAPFFLVKEDIEWVENTKKAMTLEEKIGQLFVPIGYQEMQIIWNMLCFHTISVESCIGAVRLRRCREHNRYLQEHSKIPLLVGG